MNYIRKKHWYLGLLGIVGFFELHHVIAFFNGATSAWALLGLLWFLWFDYLIPIKNTPKSKLSKSQKSTSTN